MNYQSQRYFFLFFISFFFNYLSGQEQIRQAPWQQRADHLIEVELIQNSSKDIRLKATQKLTYYNNSPVDLSEIYLHLWPNAYKNNQTPFAKQQAEHGKKDFLLPHAKKGEIILSNVKSDYKLTISGTDGEIARIGINPPLKSGEKIELMMDFEVIMPGFYSRLGADSTFIAVSQWYPKPAVFDVNGWNTIPYLDQGEFYSEFGSYNVSITVPQNFIVGATGNLQTTQEIKMLKDLSDFYLKRNPSKPTLDEQGKKTLIYVQDSVHDFAWFTSPFLRYIEADFKLESGKKIRSEFFTMQATPVPLDLDNIARSVKFYSKEVGEYPYDKCAVVIGDLKAGGGMEYPTITVCAYNSLDVILHEIGHNWFYGILGSNERRYPWMDESINTYYEKEYFKQQLLHSSAAQLELMKGKNSAIYYIKHNDKLINFFTRRTGEDQPADITSEDYLPLNYYSVIYGRAAYYLGYLRNVLGDEPFKKSMQFYYETWKFRHPLPGDFEDAISTSSGQDVSWFTNELLPFVGGSNFTISYIERIAEDSIKIKLQNKSELMIPLTLGYLDTAGKLHYNLVVVPPFSEDTTFFMYHPEMAQIHKIVIDPEHNLAENHRQRNVVKIPRLEKRIYSQPKIKLRFRPSPENPYTWDLNINPAANYNIYSGIGVGVSVFNRLFPLKDFEYDITGYYGTRTNDIIGNGSVGWNIVSKNKNIKRVRPGLDFQRYNYRPDGATNTYNKINPNLVLFLKHKGKLSARFSSQLKMEWFYVFSDRKTYDMLLLDNIPFAPNTHLSIGRATYTFWDRHGLNPQKFQLFVEGGNTGFHDPNQNRPFAKTDARYQFEHNQKGFNRKFKLQANAGTLLWNPRNVSGLFLFRGSGNTGIMDYAYNETLLGRNQRLGDGRWGQQLITAGGDMRINAISFISNHYVSFKVEQSLPLVPFLRAYADFAMEPFNNTKLYWCGGLSFVAVDDILEIYFPLAYGENFREYFSLNSITTIQRIAFKIDLNYFYPRKNIEKFRPLFGF